jgi:ribosomal peptide maturation radical SAM protein 1
MKDLVPPFKIALFSMPWALFNRPSLQLGSLKAYLDSNSSYQTDTYHPYLHLAKMTGTELYHTISMDSWAAESVFAALLFPDKKDDCEKLFNSSLKNEAKPLPDFRRIVAMAEELVANYLKTTPVDRYNLAGLSVCFSQLSASLYLATAIKDRSPQTSIVFGGSSCSAGPGESLLRHFPVIDYLIAGEGEQQLLELCDYQSGKRADIPSTVHTRKRRSAAHPAGKLLDLNSLPSPEYTPFFQEMRKTFPGQPFIPVLPVEFSRGCWWNKCSFCNLNLQWQNYRSKNSRKMVEETLHLTKKHESLHFAFTDNALPPKEADLFFEETASGGLDYHFFAEIRSTGSRERMRKYKQGGLSSIQVGIEALSSSLLQKMAKGTSVMDNILVMKNCFENGIELEGNLIIEFPSTTEKEIAETLVHLEYVFPFAPLQPARFFLGHGSPVHDSPADYGISAVLDHPGNLMLFPKEYTRSMTMLVNSYRGDRQHQRRIWQPVVKKMKAWRLFHDSRKKRQLLSYRDGSGFLIIRQERSGRPPLLHRLRGTSRKIYLLCGTPQSVGQLCRNFPAVKENSMRSFIVEMTEKRLMFLENDRVLSLAVRAA